MTKNRPDEPTGDEATSPNQDNKAATLSFEDALSRLEAIVHDLEDGGVGLAEALAHYEEGVGLLRRCHLLLRRAERRIELLRGVDADGQPIVAPLDDGPTSLEDDAAPRSQRRSAQETEAKPRKPRPLKRRVIADDESPEPPERTNPTLFRQADGADNESDSLDR